MTIPVLLPLRLETRFRPLDATPTELCIRVIPDEPWFDDHIAEPSRVELAELQSWQEARDLASDVERSLAAADSDARRRELEAELRLWRSRRDKAWERLVAKRGGPRARWLAASFPAGTAVEPRETDRGRLRKIVGLPERLEVWIVPRIDGVDHGQTAPRLVLQPRVSELQLELPSGDLSDPAAARWWNSFERAKDVGLAGTIALSPEDVAGLPWAAVVVVGLGSTPAAQLFSAHRDAGRLTILAPGLATNTVAGGPTPSRARDVHPEPTSAPAASSSPGIRRLARVLLGSETALDAAPKLGTQIDEDVQGTLVEGLWPALWGHSLGNLWATGPAIHDFARWAMAGVRPEGGLPPIRIGDQPYGVLPATALARLETNKRWDEPSVLGSHVIDRLLRARRVWLEAAEADGTVVGGDHDRALDLCGRLPVSPGVHWRKMFPHEALLLAELAEGRPITPRQHARSWDELAEEIATFGLLPQRRMTSIYGVRSVDIPLVIPDGGTADEVAAALRVMVGLLDANGTWTPDVFADPERLAALLGNDRCLLLRLARASLQLALGDEGRTRLGDPAPTLDRVLQLRTSSFVRWISAAHHSGDAMTTRTLERVIAGLTNLANALPLAAAEIDRCLRGALDATSHRLDAWLSAPALHRLNVLEDPAGILGAYGWVDDLDAGGGGPTAGGAILAPSDVKAMTAAVLRDRHVRGADASRWEMALDSRKIRDAKRLADSVRNGLHPAVALGLEVERIVADPVRIAELRHRYPARRDDGGRRVCDGMQVLDAVRAGDSPWSDVAGQELLRRVDRELGALVDTYSDLLTAEGVSLVVEGRGGVAGVAMDAAAGLGHPPSLDVLASPSRARHLDSVAVAMIPVAAGEPRTPAQLVDAHVARFLDETFRRADWHWDVRLAGPTVSADERVTLESMGLAPSDAATLSTRALAQLAVDRARSRFAISRGIELALLHAELVGADGSRARDAVGRAVRALGQRPFVLTDLSAGSSTYDGDASVAQHVRDVVRDLVTRVVVVGRRMTQVIAELTSEDERTSTAAMRHLPTWGVAIATGGRAGATASARQLESRLAAAAVRLEQAASQDDAPAPPLSTWIVSELDDATIGRIASRIAVDELSRLLVDLVAPKGDLAVTTPLEVTARLATLVQPADPSRLRDWLATTSTVRRHLAHAEAHLLATELAEAAAPRLLSTHPGDPWQAEAAPSVHHPSLLVAFAHDGATVEAGHTVAVSLIDRYAEAIPNDRRPPTMAFGFDAPAARAPQAILAVVPPGPDVEWSPEARDLLDVVLDTRALARVRMALPTHERIAELASFLPTALVPQNGPLAVSATVEE